MIDAWLFDAAADAVRDPAELERVLEEWELRPPSLVDVARMVFDVEGADPEQVAVDVLRDQLDAEDVIPSAESVRIARDIRRWNEIIATRREDEQ